MDFHTIGELHFVTTGAFGLPRYTFSTHVGCHAISSNSNAASIGLRFFNFACGLPPQNTPLAQISKA